MSESNDPWDSIKPTPPQPVPNPYSSPGPELKKGGPGYAPLLAPPAWRGDTINQLAIWGLVASIVGGLVGFVCCFVFAIPGIALSIPAFVMAQHDLKQFEGTVHPELIDKLTTSKNLALAGAIVGVVALIIGFACFGVQFALGILQGIASSR